MRYFIKKFSDPLGWQGVFGLALLILAGIFYTLALEPLDQETSFMRNRLKAAHSKAAMHARTFSLDDRQKELGFFFESLPVEADVTDVLASIYSLAEASGVAFNQAEYHLDDKDRPRLEYGIAFPVQSEYGKVRYFVSRVLAEHQAISLDQINFQRDKINDPILKTEIRFTLFLR